MTRDEARAILEAHNKWRRGDDTIPNDPPWALGRAIDVAVAELAKPAAVPDGLPSDGTLPQHYVDGWNAARFAALGHPPAPAVDVEAVREVTSVLYEEGFPVTADKLARAIGEKP